MKVAMRKYVKKWFRWCMIACLGVTVTTSFAQQPVPMHQVPITVVDVAGRTVTLQQPASRVVLAQARYFPVLGMLHPDPASILAGWSDEFKQSYAAEYAAYAKKYPALAQVPIVGQHNATSFSVERALAVQPDVVIMTASFAGIRLGDSGHTAVNSPLVQKLEAAGVPVVIVDFFIDPIKNTVPSMQILGQILGHPEKAQQFIAFYEKHMQRIQEGVGTLSKRPTVLVHAHAGATGCCNSPGVGTFNDMIRYAGGHNLGEEVLKTPTGQLGLEFIMKRNPGVYIATGTGGNRLKGLVIGADASLPDARKSLQRVVEDARLQSIAAIESGHAYGIWHGFNDSPLNVVFIEALASWLNPDVFPDVSAQKTLDEINDKFLLLPMRGTYLVDWGTP